MFFILKEYHMKIPVMLFFVSFAHTVIAMDDQSENKHQEIKNILITLEGVVDKHDMGKLECNVTYDATADTYSGTLINNNYTGFNWHSRGLNATEAYGYYQQLLHATDSATIEAQLAKKARAAKKSKAIIKAKAAKRRLKLIKKLNTNVLLKKLDANVKSEII